MITDVYEVNRRNARLDHQKREVWEQVRRLLKETCTSNDTRTLKQAGLSAPTISATRNNDWPTLSLERALLALMALGYSVTLQIEGKPVLVEPS